MDMLNFGTVDYSSHQTPTGYQCSKCGAKGVKLWRRSHTFLENTDLLCAQCAAADQAWDISTIDDRGKSVWRGMRIDQIGSYVPAVPTVEGDSFWGYTSVPKEGCDWWYNLPTLPKKAS